MPHDVTKSGMRAYAILVAGEMAINTVSATRRGAIVNGLYTLYNVPVHNAMTDEDIETIWRNRGGITTQQPTELAVVEVRLIGEAHIVEKAV